jgi:CRP-like cAMP-binding protein
MKTPPPPDCLHCPVLSGTVFGDCSDVALAEIAVIKQDQSYPAGSVLFVEDAPVTAVYCLYGGVVTLRRRDTAGIDHDVSTMSAGTLLGFRNENGHGRHALTAVASSDVTLCRIPIEGFERMIRLHPSILFRLMESFCIRIDDIEKRGGGEGRAETILPRLSRRLPDGGHA